MEIAYNNDGCNSEEEVEEACLVSVPEMNIKTNFTLYPNPASRYISILFENETTFDKVLIYNYLGQVVLKTTEKADYIDISKIGKGLYIVEITTKELNIKEKLIIK